MGEADLACGHLGIEREAAALLVDDRQCDVVAVGRDGGDDACGRHTLRICRRIMAPREPFVQRGEIVTSVEVEQRRSQRRGRSDAEVGAEDRPECFGHQPECAHRMLTPPAHVPHPAVGTARRDRGCRARGDRDPDAGGFAAPDRGIAVVGDGTSRELRPLPVERLLPVLVIGRPVDAGEPEGAGADVAAATPLLSRAVSIAANTSATAAASSVAP